MSRTQVQLGSSNSIRSTITSLTGRNSSTVDQDYHDVPSSRPKLKVLIDPSRAINPSFISSLTSNTSPVHQFTLSSRTSQVYFGSSSPITGPDFPKYISSLGASNSSTVHPSYRYASSLWKDHLRHANFSRFLEFPHATNCTCLSALISPGLPSPKLTPDGRASLVIRVIECIAAHVPTDSEADQFVREQTLDFDSAG